LKILSLECSASPASVCISEDSKIIAQSFMNVKLTHSQTLMPMIEATLKSALLSIDDIEGVSVSAGPGSFTGVRIGISVAKGITTPKRLPCVAVSSLLSMAYGFIGQDTTVCAVMDARCNQFYNAIFEIKGDCVKRCCDDRAVLCEDLISDLKSNYGNNNIIICGDGADLFYSKANTQLNNIKLAPEHLKYQSAVGVGFASLLSFANKDTVTSEELLPIYLRLPQAERELKSKNNN